MKDTDFFFSHHYHHTCPSGAREALGMMTVGMIQQAEPGHYLVSSTVERSLGHHSHLLRAPLGGVEIFVLSLLVAHWGCWAGSIYTLEVVN